MRPLAADLDQRGLVGAGVEGCIERIEREGLIRIALHALPELPDLDRGGDLVARRQPADPPGPAVDRVVLRRRVAVHRHRAEARRVIAAVAHLFVGRQDRADVEERPRRTPVGEVIAQSERADRRAGDAVAALAVMRVGEAGEQREIVGEVLAAVDARRERAGRAEGADAVVAVDLLVDAEQHRAEHAVGDHLVEALIGDTADRVAAGIRDRSGRAGRAAAPLRPSIRRRRRRWPGSGSSRLKT